MNIYAIIVGVEHYDALLDKINIELDGPASDAVRFASWLLRRDVPPANLRLFLSSLDPASQRAELNKSPRGAEVPILDATRDRVEAFFNNELPTLARTQSTLYMLWGGHGVIRGGREQHLFYSNFRKGSPLTFNVADRLEQLLAIGNLSVQHVFIDACANYVELTPFGAVDSATPVIASPDPTVRQNLIRSAASGQKAGNDRIERTGYFSRALFTLLDQYPADDWPTAEYLAPRLEQAFIEKAREDRAFRQRPVWLRFLPHEGGGFDLGSQPTPRRLQDLAVAAECSISQLDTMGRTLSKSEKLHDVAVRDKLYRQIVGTPQENRSWREDREFDLAGLAAWTLHRNKTKDLAGALDRIGDSSFGVVELVMERIDLARQAIWLLDRMGLSTSQYLEAYRRVPIITPPGKRLDFFEDIVTHLADCDELERSPLFHFLLILEPVVRAEQRDTFEKVLARANSSHIADLRRELDKNRTYRVLVSVKQNPGTVWGQLVENDVAVGSRISRVLPDPAAFLARLEEVYSELLSSLRGDVMIELILPFNFLCENLESTGIAPDFPVPIQPTPLCHRFPFTLRWRDRIVLPNKYNAEKWKRAVQYIRQRMQQPGSKTTFYTPPPGADNSFWTKMDQPEGDLIDLGHGGVAPTMDTLANALYNGAAFACWPRKDLCGNAAQYEQFIDQLLDGAFAEIPRRAVEIRSRLGASAPIALFWDDPDTDPTQFIKTFEEMKETN